MSTSTTAPARAPWHLGVVAWLFLIWSVLAVFDDAMGMVMGDAYFRASGMTPSQVAYFSSLPWWVGAATSASCWGGLCGALALLLRRRLAALLLAVSALGTLLYTLYTYFLSDGIPAMGMLWFMPALVGVLTGALCMYAARLAQRGWLR